MTYQLVNNGYSIKPKPDLGALWARHSKVWAESEAYKEANGVYNVRQAPDAERVREYEEQQLLKQENL